MTRIEELRADLAHRVDIWQTKQREAEIALKAAQTEVTIAQWALAAHDAAVEAMLAERIPEQVSNVQPAAEPARIRRSIVQEVEARLGTTPQSIEKLVEAIGGVRPAQVETALGKLNKKAKGWRDHNGNWLAGPEAERPITGLASPVAQSPGGKVTNITVDEPHRMPLADALSQPQPPEPPDAA